MVSCNDGDWTTKEVIKTLLYQLIKEDMSSEWVRFELIDRRSWFWNLLFSEQSWVEVAIGDNSLLQLNLGFQKFNTRSTLTVPENWQREATGFWEGIWFVPVADIDALIEWIDHHFATVAGYPNHRISGWILG